MITQTGQENGKLNDKLNDNKNGKPNNRPGGNRTIFKNECLLFLYDVLSAMRCRAAPVYFGRVCAERITGLFCRGLPALAANNYRKKRLDTRGVPSTFS
jgi:hypothetical protein